MKRRAFVASTAALPVLLAGARSPTGRAAASSQNDKPKPEYYELRKYQMLPGSKQKILNDFLRDAAIPAWNRLQIGPVGVFNVLYGPTDPTLYVLLPHKTIDSFLTASRHLMADVEYQKAGAPFLGAPMSDPVFVRAESSLLVAFDEMPRLEAPRTAEGKQRIFELRIYESHSETAARKKIEMFNVGGEIPIFRRAGLQPVFFAETLTGPRLPNLVYLLTFEDLQARDRAWAAFLDDPAWKKLSADVTYKDTVSNITDIILRPAPYSQV
jgi:hypothetical protein